MKIINGDRNNGHKNNLHHIFPSSHFPELKDVKWNKTSVQTDKHAIYHYFFNDCSPVEIFQKIKEFFPTPIALIILFYLNNNFWNKLFTFKIKGNKLQSIKLNKRYREELEKKAGNHKRTLKHV